MIEHPQDPRAFVDGLNREYSRLHTRKEDAFWTAYMGLADDADAARAELDRREIELARFLRDPERLSAVRATITRAESGLDRGEGHPQAQADDLLALSGWLATFEAHVIESAEARALSEEIVEAEGRLARERAQLELSYVSEDGRRLRASSVELGTRLSSDPSERVRRSAWEGLRSIEPHVLSSGFLELVAMRNRFGRLLGGEDYYDAKVRRVEGLSKTEVFALINELEALTRERAREGVEELRARHGAHVTPWNLRYLVSGELSSAQDPYFPFAQALERWGRSFAACGIGFRGAELVLDLVDRRGKYENGFMHGPEIAWREHGSFHPARIQFTANAIPGLSGAGRRASDTLFHEGGHAAHFANIDMPAPCFGQEFAPTSVGFSETQSMLLESLLSDPAWQMRYARDRSGHALPLELCLRGVESAQPFAAWNLRAMCAVCYAEKAIYEVPDDELDAARVLREVRAVEERLLFLPGGSPRPALAVPHLLAGESSAYYHGYVLAQMAVDQTRAFFRERDGELVDNPRLGPDLAEHYWRSGNRLAFGDFIENLTGAELSARSTATRASRSVATALDEARASAARGQQLPRSTLPIELDARIRVVHGRETITQAGPGGFEAAARTFEGWIEGLERERRG